MTDRSRVFLGNSPHLQERYEQALRDNAFVRTLLELSDDCVKILDLDGRLELMSPGGLCVMEIDDFTPFQGRRWLDLWQGPHSDDAQTAIRKAQAGGTGHFRGYANTAKGNRRYWDVRIALISDNEGKPKALSCVSRDITRQRELEEQQQEALAEMRHRAKNALTIVQAIASNTLKSDREDFRTFTQRLQALSRSYDALSYSNWAFASLRELLRGTLLPFDDGTSSRIAIVGPELNVSATSAMSLGLAVNELATNATKYGALSNSGGRVSVEWTMHASPPLLHLTWRETGGPPVVPPHRKGFGTALIDRAFPVELGGSVHIHYDAGGVVCEIVAPFLIA